MPWLRSSTSPSATTSSSRRKSACLRANGSQSPSPTRTQARRNSRARRSRSRRSFPANRKEWYVSDPWRPAATSSSVSSTRIPPRASSSRNNGMFGALIIVFREVIEAGLIIGIVLAATRGVNGRGRWVATGILAGTLAAGIVALFAEAIANAFEGSGQELLNAGVLGTAVVMLMWHAAWMARHGREMAIEMAAVGAAVTAGKRPMTALAMVVGLAVLREGAEVVLFLYGILASGTSSSSLFVGAALGLAAGAALSALMYYGLVSIPARHIFTVTAVLIALLAAGMAAQAVQYLDAAGAINVLGTQLWDRSPCSQLRTVSSGTPIRAANCAWVSLVRARTPRA